MTPDKIFVLFFVSVFLIFRLPCPFAHIKTSTTADQTTPYSWVKITDLPTVQVCEALGSQFGLSSLSYISLVSFFCCSFRTNKAVKVRKFDIYYLNLDLAALNSSLVSCLLAFTDLKWIINMLFSTVQMKLMPCFMLYVLLAAGTSLAVDVNWLTEVVKAIRTEWVKFIMSLTMAGKPLSP